MLSIFCGSIISFHPCLCMSFIYTCIIVYAGQAVISVLDFVLKCNLL